MARGLLRLRRLFPGARGWLNLLTITAVFEVVTILVWPGRALKEAFFVLWCVLGALTLVGLAVRLTRTRTRR